MIRLKLHAGRVFDFYSPSFAVAFAFAFVVVCEGWRLSHVFSPKNWVRLRIELQLVMFVWVGITRNLISMIFPFYFWKHSNLFRKHYQDANAWCKFDLANLVLVFRNMAGTRLPPRIIMRTLETLVRQSVGTSPESDMNSA